MDLVQEGTWATTVNEGGGCEAELGEKVKHKVLSAFSLKRFRESQWVTTAKAASA